MATYAAFKHVELYNVGKAKKRVLKPPGGGSSDIFAADSPTTPRSMKNRMQSNIFAAPAAQLNGGVKNGSGKGSNKSDSHNRLFGQTQTQASPTKNHMKSSIPFGAETNGTNGHTNGNGHANGNGSSSSSSSTNGDAVDMVTPVRKESVNPITGAGFKPEINTTVPSLNGTNQVINKNRIPPGGFSSGLW